MPTQVGGGLRKNSFILALRVILSIKVDCNSTFSVIVDRKSTKVINEDSKTV